MMFHGFAKDCEFEIVENTTDYLKYKLKSNSKTLEIYPFDFELYSSFKIINNKLVITRTVVNIGNNDMYFSMGEHPGFNCPLLPNEKIDDYVLEFEKNECVNRNIIKDGLYTGEDELFLDNCNIVKLSHELFKRKAIILKGLKSNYVLLKSKNHDRAVKVSFKGFPYLGIWSHDTEIPVVCIEPWYRFTLSVNSSKDIKKKEGIISVKSGELFSYDYSIEIM